MYDVWQLTRIRVQCFAAVQPASLPFVAERLIAVLAARRAAPAPNAA